MIIGSIPRRCTIRATLLCVFLVSGCTTTTNHRDDLLDSLKDAAATGYVVSSREDDAKEQVSLISPITNGLITLTETDPRLTLQYSAVRDKTTNTTKTFQTEVVRAGQLLELVVTDTSLHRVVDRTSFPTAPACGDATAPSFDSLNACIQDFECRHAGQLQCEANRTCDPQPAALTCRLKTGECFSVHLLYPPTRPRCSIHDLIPDTEGLLLRQ